MTEGFKVPKGPRTNTGLRVEGETPHHGSRRTVECQTKTQCRLRQSPASVLPHSIESAPALRTARLAPARGESAAGSHPKKKTIALGDCVCGALSERNVRRLGHAHDRLVSGHRLPRGTDRVDLVAILRGVGVVDDQHSGAKALTERIVPCSATGHRHRPHSGRSENVASPLDRGSPATGSR